MNTLKNHFLSHWPLLGLIGLVLVVTGDILARLLSAAFPPGFLGAAILLSACSFLILLKPKFANRTLVGNLAATSLLASVLIAATAAIPGNSSIHILAIALALGVAGTVALSVHLARPVGVESNASEPVLVEKIEEPYLDSIQIEGNTVLNNMEADLDHLFEDLDTEATEDEELLQNWKRTRLPDGSERLEGLLTLQFEAGEKILHYHLPISPALKSVPTAWGECFDPEIRIDFNILQTYGVRLTARRGSGPLENVAVQVEFTVESRAGNQAAA